MPAVALLKHISLPAGVEQREQLALREQLAALSISQPAHFFLSRALEAEGAAHWKMPADVGWAAAAGQ